MRRHSGFTLIELLVVIAIIAILAAILFPVFAKVRQKARQTTSTSNEKQIMLAMMQYVQDNDETFPLGGQIVGGVVGQGYSWVSEIMPYTKSIGVFQAPEDGLSIAGGFAPYINGGHPISYNINAAQNWGTDAPWAGSWPQGNVGIFGQPLFPDGVKPSAGTAAISRPGETVAIVEDFSSDEVSGKGGNGLGNYDWFRNYPIEARAGLGWGNGYPDGTCTPANGCDAVTQDTVYDADSVNGSVSTHYAGNTIVGFADGHVKAMKPVLTNPDPVAHPENNMWDAYRP